jgi:AbrB family looped-hinge helix DNA binding protein
MKYPKGKYAWTVKIGEKGQFVIPKEARDIFDIQPGDTIVVLADEKKGIAIPPKSMFSNLLATVFDGNMPENEDEKQ